MAQGKAFTPDEQATIIESLRPYLEAGFSRNKACEYIGLHPTTLSKWVQDSESLSMKLQGWENATNILAVRNLMDAVAKEAESEDTRKETSKWWLERRMKKEFSPRTEMTDGEGEPLNTQVLVKFINEPTQTSSN